MEGQTINLLALNIGASIKVSLNPFYYRLSNTDGRNTVEVEFKDHPQGEGWIFSQDIVGEYCGERYSQQEPDNRMTLFKVRVLEPFKMPNILGVYLGIDPMEIKSIQVIRNGLPTVLDELSHSLSGLGGGSLDN